MSELSLDALSAADKERIRNGGDSLGSPEMKALLTSYIVKEIHETPDITKCGSEHRTREQCKLSMMRFHPACDHDTVTAMLKRAGLKIEPRDGSLWIKPV